MMKMRILTTLAVALCAMSLATSTSLAQQKTTKTTNKASKKKTTSQRNTKDAKKRATSSVPNRSAASRADSEAVGAALDANLDGVCHRQRQGSTERVYKATCRGTQTTKQSKTIDCTGSRESTVNGRYKTVTCRVQRSSSPNLYSIRISPGGNTAYVAAKRVADMACGCGADAAQQTCSGGECSVSLD